MTKPLPSLTTLRAFAAAARHESLRQGAGELGVTPSAISHQVRALEDWVGAPLFEKMGRDVRLTLEGRKLAEALCLAFDAITGALIKAKADAAVSSLRVSALPLFTNFWLLSRLKRFEAAHPGITIVIETGSRLADLARDGVDVAIRNSPHSDGALVGRKLLDLRAVPLCSPGVASGLASAEDLRHATLIHLSAGSRGWRDWLEGAGVPGLKPRSNLTLDTIPVALEAASQGYGVMLGLDPLIWEAPAAKDLVVPFEAPVQSAGAYFAVYKKNDRSRAIIRGFADWIVREMRSDLPRLRAQSQSRRGAHKRKA